MQSGRNRPLKPSFPYREPDNVTRDNHIGRAEGCCKRYKAGGGLPLLPIRPTHTVYSRMYFVPGPEAAEPPPVITAEAVQPRRDRRPERPHKQLQGAARERAARTVSCGRRAQLQAAGRLAPSHGLAAASMAGRASTSQRRRGPADSSRGQGSVRDRRWRTGSLQRARRHARRSASRPWLRRGWTEGRAAGARAWAGAGSG